MPKRCPMKVRHWTVIALAMLGGSWLWAQDTPGADQPIHRMLPLAVGNSWTYEHTMRDSSTYALLSSHAVAISITHTEDIEGHTYHVFSGMPYDEPPVPFFFIAGKKVRWEGDHLLFREGDTDVVVYRFDHSVIDDLARFPPSYDYTGYDYTIPETELDVSVVANEYGILPGLLRHAGCPMHPESHATFSFYFDNRIYPEAFFAERFGMVLAEASSGLSSLWSREAVLNGERWDFWADPTGKVLAGTDDSPCLYWTAVRQLPWGVLKQEFIHLYGKGDLER